MTRKDKSGFYLFHKPQGCDSGLKDMLQFLKSNSHGPSLQFAYIETQTSLIPHLSLLENLQMINGARNWKELISNFELPYQPLFQLIRNPDVLAGKAEPWEKLTTSLIKAALINSKHILVDMDESLHGQLNLENFKKMLILISQQKNIYISTCNLAQWSDSAHTLVKRDGYKFVIESTKLRAA